MHPWKRWADDEGSAALEFITIGVIMLVPLVYLVITLGAVQEHLLGAEAAARHTARVISQAPDATAAAVRSDAVLANIVQEYGLASDAVQVSLLCTPAGVACPSAGATVIVTVHTQVQLPFIPPVFGLDQVASIPLQASSAQKVSRTWG